MTNYGESLTAATRIGWKKKQRPLERQDNIHRLPYRVIQHNDVERPHLSATIIALLHKAIKESSP
jgi:hypothetical protein